MAVDTSLMEQHIKTYKKITNVTTLFMLRSKPNFFLEIYRNGTYLRSHLLLNSSVNCCTGKPIEPLLIIVSELSWK